MLSHYLKICNSLANKVQTFIIQLYKRIQVNSYLEFEKHYKSFITLGRIKSTVKES